ncbi:MAG TPA: helix-turn-helix domain-containing protein [Caulobacterales bacterium]|nr:helix-turn-helix domain-containing protein [Caulobacterales bacterium]
MAQRRRKAQPVQARAQATRELLITATADLLGEIGVERLSSNLICERAGVTPPAFYRYFKDKYAVLEELGVRLMDAQNEIILPLLERGDLDISENDLAALLLATIEVTDAFPGGPWVLRVLRAVPALQHIRLASHRQMSAAIATAVARRNGALRMQTALQARLLIDMGYAAIELAFDEPKLKRRRLVEEAAHALFVLASAIRSA